MSTSKPSLRITLTRDVRLLASYGISPDTREMPPAMKYSQWSMDLSSYYLLWWRDRQMHQLESEGCPLSVHWPPGNRLMRISPGARHHRYET